MDATGVARDRTPLTPPSDRQFAWAIRPSRDYIDSVALHYASSAAPYGVGGDSSVGCAVRDSPSLACPDAGWAGRARPVVEPGHLVVAGGADGPVIQRDLAVVLRVMPRTVTGIVDDLAAAGLLQRVPHPTDRRAFLVTLTDDGRRLIETLRAERQALAMQLCAGLDGPDLEAAATVVDLVAGRLAAATAHPSEAVAS